MWFTDSVNGIIPWKSILKWLIVWIHDNHNSSTWHQYYHDFTYLVFSSSYSEIHHLMLPHNQERKRKPNSNSQKGIWIKLDIFPRWKLNQKRFNVNENLRFINFHLHPWSMINSIKIIKEIKSTRITCNNKQLTSLPGYLIKNNLNTFWHFHDNNKVIVLMQDIHIYILNYHGNNIMNSYDERYKQIICWDYYSSLEDEIILITFMPR